MCFDPDRPESSSVSCCEEVRLTFSLNSLGLNSQCLSEGFQNRPDLLLDPDPPYALGPDDSLERFSRHIEIVVHQHIVVQVVIADLPGRIGQPAPNHLLIVLTPRTQALLQTRPRGRKDENTNGVGYPLLSLCRTLHVD